MQTPLPTYGGPSFYRVKPKPADWNRQLLPLLIVSMLCGFSVLFVISSSPDRSVERFTLKDPKLNVSSEMHDTIVQSVIGQMKVHFPSFANAQRLLPTSPFTHTNKITKKCLVQMDNRLNNEYVAISHKLGQKYATKYGYEHKFYTCGGTEYKPQALNNACKAGCSHILYIGTASYTKLILYGLSQMFV